MESFRSSGCARSSDRRSIARSRRASRSGRSRCFAIATTSCRSPADTGRVLVVRYAPETEIKAGRVLLRDAFVRLVLLFYEQVGTIRDVVQNHLLQVLALVAMDPPSGLDHDAFLNERVRLLKAIRPLTPENIVRGQFAGYRELDGVDPTSSVETYVALRMQVETWRWAGVPFYIRAGKRLATTATEVMVELKRPPRDVFDEPDLGHPNHVIFRLGPDVSISLGARAKVAGEAMVGQDVELIAHHQSGDVMEPYERLLTEAMDGDEELFSRQDIVETSWRIVDPVLDDATPVLAYPQGSWGPKQAEHLLDGRTWHDPDHHPRVSGID